MAWTSKPLSGRTALITGCNRGIGKAILHQLAECGADVICLVRCPNVEFSQYTANLSEKFRVSIETIYADLADEDSIRSALKPLISARRRIDCLVNNAGIASGGLLQMTSMKQIREVFQVNFFATVLITQIVTKLMMRQRSGAVVNMGSVAGLDNFGGYTAYGSSKAAVMEFTRTIAAELAPYGIRVNSVAPGLTDTVMAGQMEQKAAAQMVDRTDVKRLGKPEEIANAVVFLLTDEASFITGQTMRVDGGM